MLRLGQATDQNASARTDYGAKCCDQILDQAVEQDATARTGHGAEFCSQNRLWSRILRLGQPMEQNVAARIRYGEECWDRLRSRILRLGQNECFDQNKLGTKCCGQDRLGKFCGKDRLGKCCGQDRLGKARKS